MMHKYWRSIEEVPYCYCYHRSSIKFQGYMGKKIDDLIPILCKIIRPVAAIKSRRFALLIIKNRSIFDFWGFWVIFPSSFYCVTIKLGLQAYLVYFQVCIMYGNQVQVFILCQIKKWWTRPKLGQKSIFRLFCKRFPLDSYETCFLSLMGLFLEVYRILFWVFFTLNRAKMCEKSVLFVYFPTGFHWIHNTVFKLTVSTFRSV